MWTRFCVPLRRFVSVTLDWCVLMGGRAVDRFRTRGLRSKAAPAAGLAGAGAYGNACESGDDGARGARAKLSPCEIEGAARACGRARRRGRTHGASACLPPVPPPPPPPRLVPARARPHPAHERAPARSFARDRFCPSPARRSARASASERASERASLPPPPPPAQPLARCRSESRSRSRVPSRCG